MQVFSQSPTVNTVPGQSWKLQTAKLLLALLVLVAVYGAHVKSLTPSTTAAVGVVVGRAVDGTAVGTAEGA